MHKNHNAMQVCVSAREINGKSVVSNRECVRIIQKDTTEETFLSFCTQSSALNTVFSSTHDSVVQFLCQSHCL